MLGGLAGYAIGYWMFETLGQMILDFYNLGAKFVDFQDKFNEWGLPIVFFAGLTPFPYKVITLMSFRCVTWPPVLPGLRPAVVAG